MRTPLNLLGIFQDMLKILPSWLSPLPSTQPLNQGMYPKGLPVCHGPNFPHPPFSFTESFEKKGSETERCKKVKGFISEDV